MPNNEDNNDWIATRLQKAAESSSCELPEEATNLLEEEIRLAMCERALRLQELTALAQRLIDSTDLGQDGEAESCE